MIYIVAAFMIVTPVATPKPKKYAVSLAMRVQSQDWTCRFCRFDFCLIVIITSVPPYPSPRRATRYSRRYYLTDFSLGVFHKVHLTFVQIHLKYPLNRKLSRPLWHVENEDFRQPPKMCVFYDNRVLSTANCSMTAIIMDHKNELKLIK